MEEGNVERLEESDEEEESAGFEVEGNWMGMSMEPGDERGIKDMCHENSKIERGEFSRQ